MINFHAIFRRAILNVRLSVLVGMVIIFFSVNTASIASDNNSVLYISSYHPGFPTFFQQVDGIKSVFGSNILLDIEFMDTKRYPAKENWQIFQKGLSYKLGNENLYDVIMVADDNALLFALEQQDKLFKDKPIVFLGVNNIARALEQNNNTKITGVVESVSMEDTIELMIKLHSESTQIVALVDGTISGQGDLKLFYQVAKKFSSHDFIDISLSKMAWPDFLTSVSRLGEESSVLLLSTYTDKNNTSYLFDEGLRQIKEVIKVPIFHLWHHGLGQGILGGKIISHYEQGKIAANIVFQIISGTPIEQIKVVNSSPNKYVFDYLELNKMKIHKSLLPKNSIILNEPRSFYRENRAPIWAIAMVIIILSLALLFATVNILRRTNAEENLARANIDLQAKNEDLKQAVIARQKAKKELESILNRTPDIIYRLNQEGNITFISDAIKKYGYSPEDFIGKPIIEYVHPDDRANALQRLHERRSGERGTKNLEIRFLIHKGEMQSPKDNTENDNWGIFHISSEGVYSEENSASGKYLGVQGIARDVSDMKHYESQTIKLAAVVEQAAEDVVITDLQGIIQYVNPKFETLTGYSKQEVIGKKPNIFNSGKHDKVFYANLWSTIKNGETWNGKIWNKIRDGSLILQDVTITPIFDASSKLTGYASVRRDITEQEKFEERLKQSQKMEAIGTLAGGIAHDFNNILGAILGYSELALLDIKNEDSVKSSIDQILQAGHRAKDLVRQILLFSRQTKQEMFPVKVTILAKEVIKLLRATLSSTIEVRTSFQKESGLVLSDPGQIHQIFMNLCTNAAHAMGDEGGTLTVTIDEIELAQDSMILLPELEPGTYLKIAISDSGHGIPADIQEKIFDPFFTTKSREEGTGMGLSVVHGILENHGGAINVYSEVGEGTTFNVFLPVIESEQQEHSKFKTAIPKGKEHILFVDDEPALIELGKKTLNRLGYKVTAISDSLNALEEYLKDPDRFDLVITDKSMPRMTGMELSKKIIALRPDKPIIMCTGFSESITKKQADAIGIKELLHKPIISKDIGEAIRRVLDKISI